MSSTLNPLQMCHFYKLQMISECKWVAAWGHFGSAQLYRSISVLITKLSLGIQDYYRKGCENLELSDVDCQIALLLVKKWPLMSTWHWVPDTRTWGGAKSPTFCLREPRSINYTSSSYQPWVRTHGSLLHLRPHDLIWEASLFWIWFWFCSHFSKIEFHAASKSLWNSIELELPIFLSLPLKCLDHWCLSPHPDDNVLFIKMSSATQLFFKCPLTVVLICCSLIYFPEG